MTTPTVSGRFRLLHTEDNDADQISLAVLHEGGVGIWTLVSAGSGWDRIIDPSGQIHDGSMPPHVLDAGVNCAIQAMGALLWG